MVHLEHEDKTEPSIKCITNPHLHALLVDEEMARSELTTLVDNLIECTERGVMPEMAIKQGLLTFKDYLKGTKELTDLIKQG